MAEKQKNPFQLGLTLGLFAAVACVLLAFVYIGTEAPIAANKAAKLNNGLTAIYNGATFTAVKEIPQSSVSTVQFKGAYKATVNGKLAGLVLDATGQGFQDVLEVLVGVNSDGKLAGIQILQDKDTPGLGAKAAQSSYYVDKATKTTFYGQFTGMSLDKPILVKKDGGQVDALSAATITSRAVSLIVNTAGQAGLQWLKSNGGN
jgi:electron transport complex protein RnfG